MQTIAVFNRIELIHSVVLVEDSVIDGTVCSSHRTQPTALINRSIDEHLARKNNHDA